MSWLASGLLVACVSFFGFWHSYFQPADRAEVPTAKIPPWTWRMSCARSDFLQVFDCLNESQLLHIVWYKTGTGSAPVPEELLQFFRHEVPVGRVIFGTDTLPVLMAAPVYSPIVTYSSVFMGNFVTNTTVIENLFSAVPGSNDGLDSLQIGLLFSSKKGQGLIDEMIESYQVDFVIVGPKDYNVVTAALPATASMRHRFKPVFDHADYLVLAVEASSESHRTSELTGNKEVGPARE
jgi:hypothetical protein